MTTILVIIEIGWGAMARLLATSHARGRKLSGQGGVVHLHIATETSSCWGPQKTEAILSWVLRIGSGVHMVPFIK